MKRHQIIRHAVKQSHKAQFEGMDYQKAAFEATRHFIFEPSRDELIEIESSPDPDCHCGFCATADFAPCDRLGTVDYTPYVL